MSICWVVELLVGKRWHFYAAGSTKHNARVRMRMFEAQLPHDQFRVVKYARMERSGKGENRG